MEKKFIVSYTLPYTHEVWVGVRADTAQEAILAAEAAFDNGTILDDSDDMPLLYADHEETACGHLEFEAEEIAGFFVQQASAQVLRRKRLAEEACRALVAAYEAGKSNGGGSCWEKSVDEAYRIALTAVPRTSGKSNL